MGQAGTTPLSANLWRGSKSDGHQIVRLASVFVVALVILFLRCHHLATAYLLRRSSIRCWRNEALEVVNVEEFRVTARKPPY
jgi:hypothetical protein